MERLTESALTYAAAEEDGEWERARDNLRKSAAAYGRTHFATRIREALAALKARGVRLGPPPKVEPEAVVKVVAELGDVAQAATTLRVSERTVWRALRKLKTH